MWGERATSGESTDPPGDAGFLGPAAPPTANTQQQKRARNFAIGSIVRTRDKRLGHIVGIGCHIIHQQKAGAHVGIPIIQNEPIVDPKPETTYSGSRYGLR
jgi:hypothetical protein